MKITFCGHGDTIGSGNLRAALANTIETLIREGATEFYLGGYGNFDRLAAEEVRNACKKHPDIRAVLVLPYLKENADLSSFYDASVYPPLETVLPQFAIPARNRWMVDNCDGLVCYVTRSFGGAAEMLRYAERKGKRIFRLSERNG